MARAGTGGRVLRVAAVVVGALVVLLIGLTLLHQTGPVSRRLKDLVVPRASAALGREVAVRDARLAILPRPEVVLRGASVAGRPGEPPLVELQSLDVAVEAWPLVRSLGKDVRVAGIRLVRPVVNLVRAQDGTWNYQGLGKEGEAQARGAEPRAPRAGPPAANVVVREVSVQDGSIRLLDRMAKGEPKLAVTRIDLSAEHVGLGEPLDATLSAALAGEEKNFQAEIHASRLPAAASELGPGRYPELSGRIALEGLDLARVRAFLPAKLTGMMTGGRVDADAKLGTEAEKYRLDGSGKLSQLRLRGAPAQGSFELHAVADPASGAARVDVDRLSLEGPGVDLGGSATVQLPPRPAGARPGTAPPTKVRFAVAGPLLDLGQILGLLPQQQKRPEPEQKPFQLTAEQRRALQSLDVRGTVNIEKVVKGALEANGFKAAAAVDEGALVLRDAEASLFGGRVDAAGTRLDLSRAVPAWNLKAKLTGVDLGRALTALAGSDPVVGKLSGGLDLDGEGADWATLEKELTGKGALSLQDGALTTADLGGEVLGAVAQGLRAAGKSSAAGKVEGAGGKTELRDLTAQFTVADGAMKLAKPLTFAAPFGKVALGGTIGLGGELALQGDVQIPRAALRGVAGGGGIPIPAELSVPLSLGGSLTRPSVTVNAQQAVAGLAEGAARQKAQELREGAKERARREARRGLRNALKGLGR
jgi:AsmA protein